MNARFILRTTQRLSLQNHANPGRRNACPTDARSGPSPRRHGPFPRRAPECQSPRSASPARTASAGRTVATRGIDAIVTNDCETACASSDQRRVSQRGCRAALSHADTDDVANRFARCVAVRRRRSRNRFRSYLRNARRLSVHRFIVPALLIVGGSIKSRKTRAASFCGDRFSIA